MRILKRHLRQALALLCFFSAPAFAAQGLNHDQVQQIPAAASSAENKWAPKFYFEQGCKPAVAVDKNGNYNNGLNNSGSEGGSCRGQVGQTYVRSRCIGSICAYLYALYFPKDNGYPIAALGHRHDWEDVVVWTNNGNFIGASYSQHGEYQIEKAPDGDNNFNGNALLAKYKRSVTTHALMPTGHVGETPPVIAWERLPAAARDTLNTHDWGKANCPVRDSNFNNNLRKARLPGINFEP